MLRPLPVPDAAQIVAIAAETRNDDTGGFQFFFSLEQMKDVQAGRIRSAPSWA